MKRWLLALTSFSLITAALAQTDIHPDATRHGYAFDNPEILLRQRLFGLAHGASLLASACRDDAAATAAYRNWRMKQLGAINAVGHDLSEWFFGDKAYQAGMADIRRALNLPDALPPMPDVELAAACATLPEALARERYDMQHHLDTANTR